jgi:hypothetical protein
MQNNINKSSSSSLPLFILALIALVCFIVAVITQINANDLEAAFDVGGGASAID